MLEMLDGTLSRFYPEIAVEVQALWSWQSDPSLHIRVAQSGAPGLVDKCERWLVAAGERPEVVAAMADIRSAHPEDDVFGDVGGMVSHALKIARDENGV